MFTRKELFPYTGRKMVNIHNHVIFLLINEIHKTMNLAEFMETPFLAELFRGMLFKWKGANSKSHQK